MDVNAIIDKLLDVRGARPGKQGECRHAFAAADDACGPTDAAPQQRWTPGAVAGGERWHRRHCFS